MKRGRPNKRNEIQAMIIDMLIASGGSQTVSSLRKAASLKVGKQISWNTIEKYLKELVQINKVQPIFLEHCKDPSKKGLTLYQIKK